MESVDKNNRFWLKAIAVDQDFGSASVDECVCFLISSISSGFYVEHKHAVDDEWANIRAQSTNIRMQFNGNLWTEWKVKRVAQKRDNPTNGMTGKLARDMEWNAIWNHKKWQTLKPYV